MTEPRSGSPGSDPVRSERSGSRDSSRHPRIERLLAETGLSRDEKIAALRDLAYEARTREVALEEGMGGRSAHSSSPPSLAAIGDALRELGADDAASDSKQ
jgi:hypothetical protein